LNSLETIIEGCKKNKAWAQAELFAKFSDKMYGVCCYYTNSRDDAEDLLHDGFIRLFENISKYEDGNFEAWMRKVFVNLALIKFRKDKRNKIVSEIDDLNQYQMSLSENNQLQAAELMNLVSQLPTQYRIVFNLYAIEGYKHKEISVMLDISEGTSKSNLSRARKILQDQVNQIELYQ
jgi:RNA polymerase sigma-70 factor (ECF subfamily)